MPRKEDHEKMWYFRFRDKAAKERFVDKLYRYQHQLELKQQARKIPIAEALEDALDKAMKPDNAA